MKDILLVIFGAILGVLFDKIFSTYLEYNNKKKKKILTNEIISLLSPEKNYQKVEELLGIPDKKYTDYSALDLNMDNKDEFKFESMLYYLDNAYLKVTTKDNKSICAITVLSYDEKIILPFFNENINSILLTKAKITDEMLASPHIKITEIKTIRDYAVLVTENITAPFYKSISYICSGDKENLQESDLIGFSFADSYDTAFYIYDYELRDLN